MEFHSLEEAENAIRKIVADALDTDIAKAIKDEESRSAFRVVYSAYDPLTYSRRFSLADESNMTHKVSGDLTLEVTNEAPFNQSCPTRNSGNELAMLVEYGNGRNGYKYDYYARRSEPTYLYPRPFILETADVFEGNATDEMRKALTKRGLTVE